MTAAGAEAFSHRKEDKSVIYAYEQQQTGELSAGELREFKRDRHAWSYFEATPPSYKKFVYHWITTAKKAETRAVRFSRVLQACAAGERL